MTGRKGERGEGGRGLTAPFSLLPFQSAITSPMEGAEIPDQGASDPVEHLGPVVEVALQAVYHFAQAVGRNGAVGRCLRLRPSLALQRVNGHGGSSVLVVLSSGRT